MKKLFKKQSKHDSTNELKPHEQELIAEEAEKARLVNQTGKTPHYPHTSPWILR